MEPTVILENLPPKFSADTLRGLVAELNIKGPVLSCEVVSAADLFPGLPTDAAANVPRYGFCVFELDEDADVANKTWDGMVIDGHLVATQRNTVAAVEVSKARASAIQAMADKKQKKNQQQQQEQQQSEQQRPQTQQDDDNDELAAAEKSNSSSSSKIVPPAAAEVTPEQQQQQPAATKQATPTPQQQQRTTSSSSGPNTSGYYSPVLGLHGALRYPFAPMNLGWLHEYVESLQPAEKTVAMCRFLECLMANAVSTSDPFLEHAVVNFYTKFQAAAWSKVQTHSQEHQQQQHHHHPIDGMTFELSRQVFEVIGLIRRFPSATAKSRKMLLTLVERVLDDVSKVAMASPSLSHVRDIPEVVCNVKEAVENLRHLHNAQQTGLEAEKLALEQKQKAADRAAELARGENNDDGEIGSSSSGAKRKEGDDKQENELPDLALSNIVMPSAAQIEESLSHLTSWLRYLFFTLSSTKPIQVPACPPPPPGVQVIVPCSESCSCFVKFRDSFPVYLSDVEKVKVIDALLVSGHGASAEDEMSAFARELLQRYTIDFCARAVAHVQNGHFAITRFHVFEALRIARRSQSIASAAGIVEDSRSLDLVDMALHRAMGTARGVPELSQIHDLLGPMSLACLGRVRTARASVLQQQQQPNNTNHSSVSPAAGDLYALAKHLSDIFKLLCNQQFLLCIHFVPYDPVAAATATLERQKRAQQLRQQQQQEREKQAAATPSSEEQASDKLQQLPQEAPPPPSAASQQLPPKPVPGMHRCANPSCGTTKGELLKCSACKVTWYCSRACQQADWKTHKAFCKAAAAERAAQQQQQQSPTAAAALWLAEKSDKATTGVRICDLRPNC